ncbi:ATP-binding protein [Longimicrobium sp.]|uniref:ATP-binding protein n=1 Tax=Longimicrobium sp. TaxID=2029185 RepID=UPI002BFC1A76|nr:ATP-binding protein [Longimicrobium sp.]HSU13590.1 ATP-binding protein [Longimicrobium sp.]
MSEPHPAAGAAAPHALPAELIHDLRTPLSQIIGYSEMLMERAEEAGSADIAPDLEKVRAAGYRLLELINEHFLAIPSAPPATPHASGAPAGGAGRLADFIVSGREPILAEWEAFARTCTPASGAMDITALRDHAGEMLTVIAADLRTAQGGLEQSEKSKGLAPDGGGDESTAAEEHGAGRAESGFTVEQMISEYRALRASVIRLWTQSRGELGPADLEDLTRFNEAIDQSLAESISRYTEDLDHSKEMFLAILGHDLRTPLGAVMTSARFMLETQGLKEPSLTLTSRIASSSTRMVHMVGDLLDFTRSRLGGGIPVVRAEMNMAKVVHDVVDEIAAAHPDRILQVDTRGAPWGAWDCPRITQALTNLVGNALEHGAPGSAVRVEVQGDDDEVTITIHNRGPAIPAHRLNGIFNPMKPREAVGGAAASGPSGNLGLGLYIAERIVNAHKGRIEVESSDERGTTFTVHLPRRG